jgi:hypothetical protein
VQKKPTIAIISGWLGKSSLKEFTRPDDGRSDFILKLVSALEKSCNVLTEYDDICRAREHVEHEIHLNWQRRLTNGKAYLILLEAAAIRPQNLLRKFGNYEKVFSWDDKIVEQDNRNIKFWFPHDFSEGPVGDYKDRDVNFSLIASNRNVLLKPKNSLYSNRWAVIEWFEEWAPHELELYGKWWDENYFKPGIVSRIFRELSKRVKIFDNKVARRTWRGLVDEKASILLRSKFNFCYENIWGLEGYISEKIFDCFSSGCIPIYHPSFDIPENIIPSNLYIDARKFSSLNDMLTYCKNIDEATFEFWQERMNIFCKERSEFFSSQQFVDTIVSGVAL